MVVEAVCTPLTAGIKEAAGEMADTEFKGSFMTNAGYVSGNPVLVGLPHPISTQGPADVADPELQALLREHDVDERIVFGIGAQGVKTITDFVGSEGTGALRTNIFPGSFGIILTMVKGKVAIGRALNAWRTASDRATVYESVASQCKLLDQPMGLQDSEYDLYIGSFARSRGALLEACDIPGRYYLERLIKQVDGGLLLAERLSDVISKKEEDEQRTVRTMPTCREELSERYALMGRAWEMIRLRSPTRPLLRDYTPAIFNETLLGFLFGDNVFDHAGFLGVSSSAPPTWPFVIHFEYIVREKVFKDIRGHHLSLAQSINAAISDLVYFQRDFLQPMSVGVNVMQGEPCHTSSPTSSASPASSTSSTDSAITSQLSTLIALVSKMVNGNIGARGPSKVARKCAQPQKGTQGKNKLTFNEMMRSHQLRKRLVLSGSYKVCFRHQKVRCDKVGCTFVHNCAACGAKGMGLDWCTCPRQQL